jgi:hypothetical protein
MSRKIVERNSASEKSDASIFVVEGRKLYSKEIRKITNKQINK